VSFDSSASVGCPVGHSVNDGDGDIGVIVVGSALAIILIVILFLWFYKWRDAWNEMKTKNAPTDVLTVAGLEENVRNLTERMEEVEVIVQPQPRRHEVEGHGVEGPGRDESIGSSEMADTNKLESIVQNLIGRLEEVEVIVKPQPRSHEVEGRGVEGYGVEGLGRHESIGSSEMADTSNLKNIVQNLIGRVDAMEAMARPQPIRRGTNPFRNGTGLGERHGSNASAEMADTSPLESIGETQLVRRIT